MDAFTKFFFSMRMMAVGMIVFLLAIAAATFLESAYDIQTARLIVYNAFWFEVLLIYLGINLIANIFKYKMYQREKAAMFLFHLSFIVILIGAAVTRYASFEGMMLIREGARSNFIYSSEPNLWFRINDGKLQYTYNEQMYMSEITNNDFTIDVDFPNHTSPITIEYVDFKKKMIDSLVVNDSISDVALEIITDGMTSNFIGPNDFVMIGDIALSFQKKDAMPGIEIFREGQKMLIKTNLPMRYLPMSEMQKAAQTGGVPDSLYRPIPIDTLVPFETTTLYQVGGEQFVFKQIHRNARKMKVPSGRKDVGSDYLVVKITDGESSRIVELQGGMGAIPDRAVFNFNGLTYEMDYGAMRIPIPFEVECRDFQLDKYPGSNAASSFASEVTIIDTANNFRREKRIFMNHVMDYQGYRFFQSGYDQDEGGTHLSVNHDWWGTNISYLGYLMMSIGMVMSLFAPSGRFRELNTKLKKSRARREKLLTVFLGLILSTSMAMGQSEVHHEHDGHDHSVHAHDHSEHEEQMHDHSTETEVTESTKTAIFRVMSEAHSEEVASLLVQDFQGRIIPFHTLSDQLLRKVSRNNFYKDYNAIQAVMSMHMYPDYWVNEPLIYVDGKSNLREKLGLEDGYISYADLTDEKTGEFILMEDYSKAHHTMESKRGEYDKRVLKLGERYQVVQMIFSWNYMKIIPVKGDDNNTWYVPLNMELMKKDSASSGVALRYLSSLDEACKNNTFGKASDMLVALKSFQREAGASVVPSEKVVSLEISYNKMNIFKNSYQLYLLAGIVLLLIFFVRIFLKPSSLQNKWRNALPNSMIALVIITFLYHGYGLLMRSMITGHAPWSNGYEAVVFIAWASVLTGLFFTRKNMVILAGTAILAALMIFVTEMNLMDPEITPLQPVLKSYWLMIHVAIITGSYGPLGIACILGLLNLVLYVFRNKRNGKMITLHINELTYVSEMNITIGLFMLTIGTFLGGIWANESWGRYWGWDPKETWALVAILVYAVIIHLRYIPALKNKFLFNAVSFWGYSSILFTFFGVNFYLVGLHSYAQGEGLGKIPNGLIVTVILFTVFTVIAYLRYRSYSKQREAELVEE